MTNEADIEAMARAIAPRAWKAYDNGFDGKHSGVTDSIKSAKAAYAASPVERLRKELDDAQANYSGAMADIDALVNAFYAACPDNYFLNANYPREGSSEIVACRDRALAENERLRGIIGLIEVDLFKASNKIKQALEGPKS